MGLGCRAWYALRMSEREHRVIALIDAAASVQTAADRAYLRESLAYGNLKLEDGSLTRDAISVAAQAIAVSKPR